MKGVILAGGTGSRLKKLTQVVNKHLLPIYDTPMIDFPLSLLINSGIKQIMIVTDKTRAGDFMNYLGTGRQFGIALTYGLQDSAAGISDALLVAENFVNSEQMTVILGDNIFFDPGINLSLQIPFSGRIFLKEVEDGKRFGVAAIDENGKLLALEEKPESTSSAFAITGLYQYKSDVFDIIKTLRPSHRNELEITDLNASLLESGDLDYEIVDCDWLDAGTFESLFEAQERVRNFRLGRI